MRFVWGPIPPSRVLNPQEEQWTPLRELGAGRLALVASLLGLPFFVAAVIMLRSMSGQLRGLVETQPLAGVACLLAFLAMMPVHELIHGLGYGPDIRSPHLIIGAWPSRGICYAIYDSPLPRTRVLRTLVAPFLVLSLLPLVCLPWLEGSAWGLGLVFSLLHAAMSAGDFIVLWSLVSQVPRNALVHNNGWQTYWSTQPAGDLAKPRAPSDQGQG